MGRRTTATAETAAQTADQSVSAADTTAQTAASIETVEQTGAAVIPTAYADYEELTAVVAAPLGLNLRSGPGPGYGVLEVLADGAAATILPLPYSVEVKGWALVSVAGRSGWCMADYLTQPPGEE